jgi:hypothetical protein
MNKWEYFSDGSYYDMWAVRLVGEKRWGYCYHLNSRDEAKALCELLNEQEKRIAELEEALRPFALIVTTTKRFQRFPLLGVMDLCRRAHDVLTKPTRYETEAKESTLDPNTRPAPAGNQPAEGAD